MVYFCYGMIIVSLVLALIGVAFPKIGLFWAVWIKNKSKKEVVIYNLLILIFFAAMLKNISDNEIKQIKIVKENSRQENIQTKTPEIDPSQNNVDSVKDNIYTISSGEVELRNGPGMDYEKIKNIKASEVTGKDEFCSLDNTCDLKVEETKEGWSKVTVISPEWLSETHRGWIQSEYLVLKNNLSQKNIQEVKSFAKLYPSDIYINLEKRGFKTKTLKGKKTVEWRCEKDSNIANISISIFGNEGLSINSLQATIVNYSDENTSKLSQEILSYVASVPYEGAEPEKASEWVKNNINKKTISAVIGNAKFELFHNSDRTIILSISPV